MKEMKSPQLKKTNKTIFSPKKIEEQLHRILHSPDFDATKQQRAFLHFVVSETLANKAHSIKGYAVATRVFGRDENFDQAIDPIVSIQANKLRRSLERYYLLSGKDDPIQIDLPKGTYVPVFIQNKAIAASSPTSRRYIDRQAYSENAWPSVLIKPFHNYTNDPEKNYWSAGFAVELATTINSFQWIHVLQGESAGRGRRNSDIGARFVVEGFFTGEQKDFKVIVNLIDTKTTREIWSDTMLFRDDVTQPTHFQEQVALTVSAIIAGEQGIITRNLCVESRDKKADQLTTYEAILRYHKYDQTLAPEDFVQAFEALEIARENEPECGQLWSFLARLYANIYSLEIPGFDLADSKQKALQYAERGARLNPHDQGALGVLALVRMFSDNITTARRDIQSAYEMYPNSLYLMDGIGYIKTLLGDWKQGPELIRKSIELNPYYKTVVHYALWVDYLRQQDFENAYLETSQLRRPDVFWYPLAKASTLGLLGRIEEGKKFADDLLQLKPDFGERGRVLIRRYVKFDDIADQIIRGLAAVGIKVR